MKFTSIQNFRSILLPLFTSLIFLSVITTSSSKPSIPIGYQLTLSIPTEYVQGFIGKAILMTTTSSLPPGFTTALVVEAINEKFTCSLELYYIGTNIRVWSSGHRSKFFTTDICVLELTQHGDLRLKGRGDDDIGWRTGTTEQGVQKLQLLDSGNLVLVNGLNRIIWQSFNFPTNTLLLGQRLSVATHLTAYRTDSRSGSNYHYSLEIQHDKLALYLNTPLTSSTSTKTEKYCYWELQPSEGKNITFVNLSSKGLELFDDSFRKFAQIEAISGGPINDSADVRFMSIDNATGNLGMYCYDERSGGFDQPCYKAIESSSKSRCDLPLTCESNYSVCTLTGECECITVSDGKLERRDSVVDCEDGIGGGGPGGEDSGICGGGDEEMIEVERAVSVFKTGSYTRSNVSRNECVELCLKDCGCRGLMYGDGECVVYGWVLGVKEIERVNEEKKKKFVYMVKVGLMRRRKSGGGLKGWVLVVVVVGDGLILLVVVAGIGYFVVWRRRRKRSLASGD